MSVYYANTGYFSTPGEEQTIPTGGNHPLHLPTTDQTDPWEMHPERWPDGTVIDNYLTDDNSALFRPPVSGIATIQIEAVWAAGATLYRHSVVTELGEVTATSAVNEGTWTLIIPVVAGEGFAVLVGHDAVGDLGIDSAKVTVVIHDPIAEPPARRVRVREGTTPQTLRR